MTGSAALTCRMHDPERPGVYTDHHLWWKGGEGVIECVEAPQRIRPGRSVRLPAVTFARNSGTLQLRWESDAVRCEWRQSARCAVDNEQSAIFSLRPDNAPTCEADFCVVNEAVTEPHDTYPRLHVGRVSLAHWFVALTHTVSLTGVAIGIVGLIWLLFNSCDSAILMLLGGSTVAILSNPFLLRNLNRKVEACLPSQTEHLGTISIPRIVIEPAIIHSTAVSSPVIRAYCESVVRQITDLHVLGIAVPVSAEAGYIPIALRTGRITQVPSSVPKEAYTEIDRIINQDKRLKNLLDGTRHSLEEAWQLHRYLTIVGDAGSGKTTALRRLSHRLAAGAVHWTVSVPVYLELHRVARRPDVQSDPVGALRAATIDRIEEILHRDSEGGDEERSLPSRDDIARVVDLLITNGELTRLLDGLDEVPDDNSTNGESSV
ncbi:MAG TPA: NACHT domain-containing protein, partial [Firmicutes bacterium]|nr:NACHT domain-containing protein [Bacillota bacterium]